MEALLSIGIPFAFFAWLFWTAWRKRRAGGHKPAEDRDLPYTIFTREFDVVCSARKVREVLLDPATEHYPGKVGPIELSDRVAEARAAIENSNAESAISAVPEMVGNVALAVLIDQSGSIADRIPAIAGELKQICRAVEDKGIHVALFGHTTRGWQGGLSRKKWLGMGKPSYPGRLTDLLHVVYKTFDSPMAEVDWECLMLPSALRENVDGEALEWIEHELAARREPLKLAIVLSDGASVDDSTLYENGPLILDRHLRDVITRLENDGKIVLAAIGIDHWVERYYGRSARLEKSKYLPVVFSDLLCAMLTEPGDQEDDN